MTAQTDTRSSIVAAVQKELNRFSKQVSAEVQRLQSELAAERAARVKSEETLKELLPAIEQRLGEFTAQTKRRHDELEIRIGRVSDETNAGLAAAVESAARPVVKQLEHRQDRLEQDLSSLDRSGSGVEWELIDTRLERTTAGDTTADPAHPQRCL